LHHRYATFDTAPSWIASSLFASLIPSDRHHEFFGKWRHSWSRSTHSRSRRQPDHETLWSPRSEGPTRGHGEDPLL